MRRPPRDPTDLEKFADQPRVLVRRGGAPRRGGKCVVYWMQRAMRIVDNPALDVAIEAGNLLGLPVVVFLLGDLQTTRMRTCGTTTLCSRACGTWKRMQPSEG